MNQAQRAYIEGDQVIARRALVSPPAEAWGIGVEIPSGTTGRIVDVRDPQFRKPYIASFDIGNLEICVDEDDIGLLYPAAYTPEPDPVTATFIQSVDVFLPHRRCHGAHMAQNILMGAGLAVATIQQPFAVRIIMGLIVAFVLLMFMMGRARKTEPELPACQTIQINDRWAAWALRTDIFFIWSVLGCLSLVLIQSLTGLYLSAPEFLGGSVFYPAVGVAMVAWVAKEVAHHRATNIVDSCDE